MRGSTPRLDWKPNPDGIVRSVEEAVKIARANGVVVPDFAAFFVDEYGFLDEHTTARGPRIRKPAGQIVVWADLLNRYGQVPFLVRRDILESDEAIVAVFAHEMHELHCLKPLLHQGRLTIEQFGAITAPENHGNLHDEAWDVADKLVAQMRSRTDGI